MRAFKGIILLGKEYSRTSNRLIKEFPFVRSIDGIDQLTHIDYFNLDLFVINTSMIHTKKEWEYVQWLSMVKLIPVVLLIGKDEEIETAIEFKCFDFIRKPITYDEFRFKIENYISIADDVKYSKVLQDRLYEAINIRNRSVEKLNQSLYDFLFDLMQIDSMELSNHDARTKDYVEIFINHLISIPNQYRQEVLLWDKDKHIKAASFHDIGKIFLPSEISMKTGNLTEKEYEIMKTHVFLGISIIDKLMERDINNDYLSITKKYIESHHEKWNGSGYPYGLKKLEIPLEGRIMAICDAYDSICNFRVYKESRSHEEAIRILNEDSGTHFDPELIRVLNIISIEFKLMNNRHKILYKE